MEYQTTYFLKSDPKNTEKTLTLVAEWVNRLEIETILVASTSGKTGVHAVEKLKDKTVIVVTHSAGFQEENQDELLPENKKKIEESGGQILTCQHALGGISRAIRMRFKTIDVDDIVANTLRLFGQGLKVAVEITLMAADAGLIPTDQDVIAVGGSGYGADTAAIIKPANVSRFFDLKIRGILCKPWNF